MADLEQTFLEVAGRRLTQHRDRIVVCLGKLETGQIWSRDGEHENSIGNLVLHVCGNVRQWIGHGVGGRSDIRVRDREFQTRGGIEPAELIERVTSTVDEALEILRGPSAKDLLRMIQVQNYNIPVVEAVFHVVDHFAQHTGQIFLLTKHVTGEDLGFYRHLSNPAHGQKTP